MAVLNRDFNVPSGIIVGAKKDNFLHLHGADTGNSVSIVADGTDANISITLVPKGIGTVNIPTSGMTFPSGTNNGVLYLDSSGSISSSPNLLFSGTNITLNGNIVAKAFIPSSATAPTNGMYLKDTNTIGFSTNSTGAMYISPTGKVGIGAIASSYILETNSDASIHTIRVGLGNNNIASNTIVGNQSLNSNTSGSQNSAFGQTSLKNNTTGSQNSSFGFASMFSNTVGSDNTAVGYNTLFSNLNGSTNTAFGAAALQANYSGNNNTGLGAYALFTANTASNNTGIGVGSLFSTTIGSNNTATGYASLYTNNTGDNNTSFGNSSLYSNTIGSSNVAVGYLALYGSITGDGNTALGYSAGYSGAKPNTSGSRNTFLGYQTSVSAENIINSTAIGNGAQVTESNQIVIGNSAISTTLLKGRVLIETTTNPNSARLMVNGLIETTDGIQFSDGSKLTSATPGILNTVSISGTSKTTVDSFAIASYRSAKYFVQITNATKYHVIELLLVHDNSTVFLTQYGEIFTSTSLGTFDAEITTGNLNLTFTPVLSLTTVKVLRQNLGI